MERHVRLRRQFGIGLPNQGLGSRVLAGSRQHTGQRARGLRPRGAIRHGLRRDVGARQYCAGLLVLLEELILPSDRNQHFDATGIGRFGLIRGHPFGMREEIADGERPR